MSSSRGGRRGGGRGRGGYTPPSGAQLYLKRSAQEAGLDSRNLRALQDMTMSGGGALFPPLKWHSSGTLWKPEQDDDNEQQQQQPHTSPADATTLASPTKRSSSTTYLIQKGRDLRYRMQSQYQVRPSGGQEQDVMRHVRKNPSDAPTSKLTNSPLYVAKRVGPLYVPMELLEPSITVAKQSNKRVPVAAAAAAAPVQAANAKPNLQDLEEKERTRRSDGERGEGEESAALPLDQNYDVSDEEEEAADYTTNYYESEGEESDGGGRDGGEPTF